MEMKEYVHLSAQRLAHLIKSGETTPKEVLACAFERLEAVNPSINAVVEVCRDWAEKQLDQMTGEEPYFGVPLLVKDLGFAMKGVPITNASRFFMSNKGLANSDFIARALQLGFVPFARTNTPELGLSYVTESELFGPCRNPYDINRTTGGSSGGSAAGVAMGIAPVATASDGGGSIRIPAACCGLFGFKPSQGIMPTGPWAEEEWSGMATSFVLTRSIEDAVELAPLFAVSKFQQVEKNARFQPLTIVILDGAFAPVPIDQPCQKAMDRMVEVLRSQGHRVENRTLSLNLEQIGDCTLTLIAANVHAEILQQESVLGRKVAQHDIEEVTWRFNDAGKSISAAALIAAKNRMYQLLRPLHALFNEVDFVLSPALAKLPLAIGDLHMKGDFERYLEQNVAFSPFTSLFNQAGMPAMTIPVCHEGKLPVSVQFAAAKGMDHRLLQLVLELQPHLPDTSRAVYP